MSKFFEILRLILKSHSSKDCLKSNKSAQVWWYGDPQFATHHLHEIIFERMWKNLKAIFKCLKSFVYLSLFLVIHISFKREKFATATPHCVPIRPVIIDCDLTRDRQQLVQWALWAF